MVSCWAFVCKKNGDSWSATCRSDAELTPEAVEAASKRELESKLREIVVEKSGLSRFSVNASMVNAKTAICVFSIAVAAPAGGAAPAAGAPAAGGAAAAAAVVEEPEEEEEDLGFDLFG